MLLGALDEDEHIIHWWGNRKASPVKLLIEKQHFKKKTITSLLKFVTPTMHFTITGLKYDYYAIYTSEEYQK